MKNFILILIIAFSVNSCKKTERLDDCTRTVLTFSTTINASDPCAADGSISINTSGNYLFKLNSGVFSSTSAFNNLLPGKYAVHIKSNNCLKTDSVVVPVKNAGVLFVETKAVLAIYCIGCHSGLNPQAGLDWTDNCAIVNNQTRIKARAIDGNPATMPPTGLMPITERNKILTWINAGAKFTD